jgi:CRP-like cAMP-binding protein
MTLLTIPSRAPEGGTGSAATSKLEAFTRFSADDREALVRATRNIHHVDARHDVISEGERPRNICLVLDGWACRYKQLADGKRQIVSLFVPGDFCDVHAHVLKRMDHSIGAITRVKLATITPEEMGALVAGRRRIAEALWWHEMVDAATQREWTLNLGQRSAHERLAHLLVELYFRLSTVGRARDGRCDFPLTQNDLADATGLTSVHINRTLQDLRRDSLIELERKQLQILDLKRMMKAGMFNPNYLHLEHEGRHLDAHD